MGTERILVIGGAGFLGSKVAALLAAEGHQAFAFDMFQQFSDPLVADYSAVLAYRKQLLAKCTGIVRGDASNPLDLLRAFDEARPDCVIHLGGMARPPLNDVLVSRAVEDGVQSVTNAFQLAERVKVKRFLLVSSSYVYGDFQYSPCDEQHPCNPTTVYGAIKLSAEALTRALSVRFRVPYTIIRFIGVYGPGDLNGKLSVQNLRSALSRGVLPIGGAPGEGTDYTYVDDAARGLVQALFSTRAVGETINIARGRARTVSEVVEVLSRNGHSVHLQPSEITNRPKRGPLAIDKARNLFGYAPSFDLEQGLPECLAFLSRTRSVFERSAG